MLAFLLSAVLGIVRQILFNRQFGATIEASAYYAAFRLPDTFAGLIAGGALSGAMIPVLLQTAREDGDLAERHLADLVFTTLLVVFVPLTVLGMIATPWFVATVLAPGFDPAARDLTVALTRIMLLQPVILVLSTVAIAVTNSRNQFLLSALAIVIHNVTLIGGVVVAMLVPGVGVLGPTIGLVLDALLQTAILLPGLWGNGFHLRLAWDLGNQRLRQVLALLIPSSASVTINYAGTIADTAYASLAAQSAGLPALQNAFLLIGLPTRLLGIAVGQAAFPRMAAAATESHWHIMRSVVRRALLAVVALSVLAAIGLASGGRLLVRALFEHGRYGVEAGDLTYVVLVAYAVGLPFYVATEVITRGLVALCDTRTPLVTNTMQVLGRIAMLAVLVPRLGVVAVPVALAATSAAEALILGVVLFFRIRR